MFDDVCDAISAQSRMLMRKNENADVGKYRSITNFRSQVVKVKELLINGETS